MPNNRKKIIKEIEEERAPDSIKKQDEDKPERTMSFVIWVIAAVSVAVLLFAVSSLLVSATIKITPHKQNTSFDGTTIFKAARNVLGSGVVQYEMITVSKEGGKEVSATEEKDVEIKASGKIVIYNNYSAQSQRLIKNTRFEAPNGLIYRIVESVTVPGKTTKDGKSVPGSVEVAVFADEPGEKYNISPTDFTIPGFKGSPQYSVFYARSKTALTGGFKGKMKQVGEETLAQAKLEIQTILKSELLKEAATQVRENYILYEGAVVYVFEDLPQENITASGTEIRQKGIIYAVVFDRNLLVDYLGSIMITLSGLGTEIEFLNLKNLTFSFKDSFDPQKMTQLSFTLKGSGIFIALFDSEKLRHDLAGSPRSKAREIFETYNSIAEARVTVMPFWRDTLPEDVQKIKIERVLEKTP